MVDFPQYKMNWANIAAGDSKRKALQKVPTSRNKSSGAKRFADRRPEEERNLKLHPPRKTLRNQITRYTKRIFSSEYSRYSNDPGKQELHRDLQLVLEGHCIYLPGFFESTAERKIRDRLLGEWKTGGHVAEDWSRHQKLENPEKMPTFQQIVLCMSAYFDVTPLASRLNIYPSGEAWKPYHHDSHAYGAKGTKEDFTCGASFGGTRCLSILHPPTNERFGFPQKNGDVFAFDTLVNTKFQHGIPKSNEKRAAVDIRLSVIVWGRRNKLTERNGGVRSGEAERENQMAVRIKRQGDHLQKPRKTIDPIMKLLQME